MAEIILFRSNFQPNTLSTTPWVQLENLEWIFGTYKRNVSISLKDTTNNHHVFFFTLPHITFFFIKPFLINGSQIIHFYTWSAKKVTVDQHKCCFFKTSYSAVFFSVNYFNFILQGQMVPFFFPYMASHTHLFNLPPRHTAFRCSFNFTFSKQKVSPLYTLR